MIILEMMYLTEIEKVAVKFSKGLDRPIKHIKLSEEEKANKYQELGVPVYLAKLLAMLEARLPRVS